MLWFLFTSSVLLILVALYLRETKLIIELVGKTIINVEEELNEEEGQKKLDVAVGIIKKELPCYLSIFATKRMLVSIIEFMLSFINSAFGIDKRVDIKGNESKIDVNFVKLNNTPTVDINYNSVSEKEGISIYGKIRAETDFKGKNNASVEIGFQKRF